jgi:Bacterial regulatory helix-turn-helix protein, lysR family
MRWFDGLAMSSRKSPLRFDLTSLQLFVAVAEELSLTKAAHREHLVLSAASKRIAELEDAVGSPLLYRHARGVTLTPAGQSLPGNRCSLSARVRGGNEGHRLRREGIGEERSGRRDRRATVAALIAAFESFVARDLLRGLVVAPN